MTSIDIPKEKGYDSPVKIRFSGRFSMKYFTLKRTAVITAGALLFFLLGRFVSIASPIETVDICVQYGLLGYLAVTFGPLTGTLSGLLGHILIDLTYGELCWSWILATAAFGGLMGVLSNVLNLRRAGRDPDSLIRFNLCQVAIHVVCWAGVAPVLEILFYSESMDRIFEQGLTAGISNAVTTAIIGSGLLLLHNTLQSRRKS